MQISSFVIREAIVPTLQSNAKEAVIREMVESLRCIGRLPDKDAEEIVKAILKREKLGSTGIGQGVAIPHAKHKGVDKLIGTVAISRAGVAFESVDGHPVHVFLLLVSPQDKPGDHLRALENVSRSLRDENFVRSLRSANTRESIWDIVTLMSANKDNIGSTPKEKEV